MTKRTADVREHFRQRAIQRRLSILHNVWRSDYWIKDVQNDISIRYEDQPNRLSKWNLTCGCRHHKWINDEDRRMYQHREDVRARVELDDWLEDDMSPLCEEIYNDVMYGDPEWEREIGLSD